ncbi:aromatic acid/H+ symport family MFS transporter [Leifsonia sp. NPDC077715]|uniref:MFS transporter n=1 Tax=Leifsonia sp. NPDC077715 TaxID=3155539 RepID=UPI003426851F
MTSKTPPTTRSLSLILCWLVVVLDGFDLVVLGAVIPTLLATGDAGFNAGAATLVATTGLVGVGLGAITVGPLADRYGRRGPLTACVALFSLCTLGIAFAPSVLAFGLLRFLAGVGLGACLPVALAAVSEFVPEHWTGRSTTLTMTGYHTGAVLTALLALVIIPEWRWMFAIGGIAGLVLLPVLWFLLPESARLAASRDGRAPSGGTVRALVRGRFLRVSLGVWLASFMGLLLVYGLNTWLPQLMATAGYATADALVFLLVLNVGAVTGLLIAGWLADARGPRRVALIWFGLAAVFLALLSIRVEAVVLLFVAVFITGVFVYPPETRATALGYAAGLGRLGAIAGPAVTGLLVTLGQAYPGSFYVFALTAVVAAIGVAIVPPLASASDAPLPVADAA